MAGSRFESSKLFTGTSTERLTLLTGDVRHGDEFLESDTGSIYEWTGSKWLSVRLFGANNIHDADVHNVPVNELFHRHLGTATTLTAATIGGVTKTIQVASGVGFSDGDPIQIDSATIIETTLPIIISGGGTTTFALDRPLDTAFEIGDSVELISTNLAVDGSVTPVSFQVLADLSQVWHIVRFLLAMTHTSSADDSKFGSIAALTNGCILRGFNGGSVQYRTFTNWKTNFDIKMDMFDLDYTTKAGAGNFGTNGRGSIKDGTGAVPRIVQENGDFLELLIQDDLTGLIKFNLKAQGHIEGL